MMILSTLSLDSREHRLGVGRKKGSDEEWGGRNLRCEVLEREFRN